MVRLASACRDEASRRDTGCAGDDSDLYGVCGAPDETGFVDGGLGSVDVSSTESLAIWGSGNIFLTLLNEEVFRWLL